MTSQIKRLFNSQQDAVGEEHQDCIIVDEVGDSDQDDSSIAASSSAASAPPQKTETRAGPTPVLDRYAN